MIFLIYISYQLYFVKFDTLYEKIKQLTFMKNLYDLFHVNSINLY